MVFAPLERERLDCMIKLIATEMAIRLLIQCNEINSVGIEV